jgi:hypothetical protein
MLGYPNEFIDFWRPDNGRNRTCFFKGKPRLLFLQQTHGYWKIDAHHYTRE